MAQRLTPPEAGLFLLYVRAEGDQAAASLNVPGDACMLDDSLYLVRSTLSRSRLYHHIKRQLPADTPLLVAPLASDPKFKDMCTGALKWLREAP